MPEYRKIKKPTSDKAYYQLSEVAALLEMSEESLLDLACKGEIRLFIRAASECDVFSVHEDAIDLDGSKTWTGRYVRQTPTPDPGISCPVKMSGYDTDVLLLSADDCYEIRNRSIFTQYFFQGGYGVVPGGVNPVSPQHGQHPFTPCKVLSQEGWKLALYLRNKAPTFINGKGYSRPVGVDLSIDKLIVAGDELNTYIDSISIDSYIAEFFAGANVVDERPDFFSGALNYMIDTSEKYWRVADRNNTHAFFHIKRKVSVAFENAEFCAFFGKHESKNGVRETSEKLILPIFARAKGSVTEEIVSQYRGYITPELEVLMAASKRYWGQPTVCLEDRNTHPLREDIVAFLVDHGFTGNDAKYGATILKPMGAAGGPRRRAKNLADKLK